MFVTRDIGEAVKMGDRIAIMREGSEIAQYDTPENVLAAPAGNFVRHFIGTRAALRRGCRPSGAHHATGLRRRWSPRAVGADDKGYFPAYKIAVSMRSDVYTKNKNDAYDKTFGALYSCSPLSR